MILLDMAKKKTAPAASKVQEMLVNVVLDRSGSMSSCQAGTISGYNEYLKGLRADAETKYNITLIQFDSPGASPELTVSYQDKPLADVPDLTENTFEPRGMTPLYDAIGESIRRVDVKGRGVITVIITDGYENSSQEFNKDSVKALITGKESEGWKFLFLGANIDSAAVGGSLGVAASACANYVSTDYGTHATFTAASASNVRYATAMRAGGQSVASSLKSFTEAERSSMMGGGAAAPSGFHTLQPTAKKPNPVVRKRTNWAVKSN